MTYLKLPKFISSAAQSVKHDDIIWNRLILILARYQESGASVPHLTVHKFGRKYTSGYKTSMIFTGSNVTSLIFG